MARSINQIYNEIVDASQDYPALSNFSTSTASIPRLIMQLVATAIHGLEITLDVFKIEIREVAREASPGTERWYTRKAYDFQYSDTNPQILKVTDRRIAYEVINEDLQIVSQAATNTVPDTVTNRPIVFIKLAKGDVGALEPLSSDELNSAITYFNNIKMAGQQISVISNPPDRLYIDCDIFIDGQYIETQVLEDINTALENFLVTLDFNGIIYYQKVVDVLQSVDGVQDVVIRSMAARDHTTDFSQRTNFIKEYNPDSGYVILEDDTNNNLENSLNIYVV